MEAITLAGILALAWSCWQIEKESGMIHVKWVTGKWDYIKRSDLSRFRSIIIEVRFPRSKNQRS